MTSKNKHKLYLTIAIIFFILSVIIFVFADGLRRWYSGGFFLIIGGVVISKALVKTHRRGFSGGLTPSGIFKEQHYRISPEICIF